MSELNRFKKQTAVAIITCNREAFFNELVKSIDRDAVDKIFVVCAGDNYKGGFPDDVEVLRPQRNPCVVGIAKNIALRKMREAGYTYLFVIEDDVKITDNKVFEKYIETAADSGLWYFQLSYGLHGGIAGGNVNDDGTPRKLQSVQYTKNKVDVYQFSFAAFSFTHRDIFGINEEYSNACEHLDTHMILATRRPICGTPLHSCADIYNSHEYIIDQSPNHQDSVIRTSKDFKKNFSDSWQLFKHKWGKFPAGPPGQGVEPVHPSKLLTTLEGIESLYAIKELI